MSSVKQSIEDVNYLHHSVLRQMLTESTELVQICRSQSTSNIRSDAAFCAAESALAVAQWALMQLENYEKNPFGNSLPMPEQWLDENASAAEIALMGKTKRLHHRAHRLDKLMRGEVDSYQISPVQASHTPPKTTPKLELIITAELPS